MGALVKKRRVEIGMSQERLAEELGVTYQQVQRYENGATRFNVENIQLVARILGLDTQCFFSGTPADRSAEGKAPFKRDRLEEDMVRYFRKIRDRSAKTALVRLARTAAQAK